MEKVLYSVGICSDFLQGVEQMNSVLRVGFQKYYFGILIIYVVDCLVRMRLVLNWFFSLESFFG